MESTSRPTPLPRTTREVEPKKPVPLPRQHTSTTPLPVKSVESSPSRRVTQAVIEGTRNVGELFERTVRSMRDKRRSELRPQAKVDKPELIRSQSLPSQDIFETIHFRSPLDSDDKDSPECDTEDDFYYNPDLPPPVYPPPPLPDESNYDHVIFRTVSSNAGSESAEEPIIISPHRKYEEEVAGMEMMDADTTCGINEFEDPTSERFSRTISFCSEALSLLDDDSDEDMTQHSSSSQSNDLYVNWDSPIGTPMVPLRGNAATEKRNPPSQSVIFEFDPLYMNVDNFKPAANNNYDHLSLAHTLAPYGKINKVPEVEEGDTEDDDDDGSPCPVVPPTRYDSITPTPDVPPAPAKYLTSNSAPGIPPHLAKTSLTNDASDPTYSNFRPDQVPKRPTNKPNQQTPEASRHLKLSESSSQVSKSRKESTMQHLPSLEEHTPVSGTVELRSPLSKSQESLKERGPLVRWSSMKKAMRQVAEGSRRSMDKFSGRLTVASQAVGQGIERPPLSGRPAKHSGVLFRGRELSQRYCVLVEGRLTCYSDTSQTVVREVISLNSVLSIQLVQDHRTNSAGEEVHSWQLGTAWKGQTYELGCNGSTERRVWMQKILESLTSTFSTRLSSDFSRAGWCFMKQSISGSWCPAWLLLSNRSLFYACSGMQVQEVDLRKARCVDLQDCGPDSPTVTEPGQLILVDSPGQSLYLLMDLARETVLWRSTIKASSVENGPNLAQQQLTKEDIPAIVDKCISFVYAHGSMSEGIYRRNGASTAVVRLMSKFRADAWSVQLSRAEYTEFDVATAIKRFFRDLPESLLSTELHDVLCEIADSTEDKLELYRKTLQRLEPINFLTLRKLLGHLHFIQQQKEKTLMTIKNLAAIWGPTLMHNEGQDSLGWSRLETAVISDLLHLYPMLFDVDQEEQQREKRMREALERIHAANSSAMPNKPSGDIKVWVHIGTRDSKNCVQVSIGPQKLAGEVCSDLQDHVKLPTHSLCLEEVVMGGALTRPMHHTERVLDVVLRWGYWKESQRRNNCLVITKNQSLVELSAMANQPAACSGELKFADARSRSFKNHLTEFAQAKLSVYKDKSGTLKLGEWKIEDIVWFIGHESKRNPNSRWAITFIEKNLDSARAQENTFFGCTIAGTTRDEQLRWTAAMLVGQYQQDILPKPLLLH